MSRVLSVVHRLGLVGACLWFAACCARSPQIIVPTETAPLPANVDAWVAAHPLPEGQNILALPLGRTAALSYHLVQIRDREQPHIHATHDLAVTVLRGTGIAYVGGQPHTMRAGDVAVVPHGTPHYFVNTGSTPSVTFATFAPPYDGTDQVPIAP